MDGVFETQPDRTDLPLVVMPVVIESMIGPFKQNFTMPEYVALVRMYEDFTLDAAKSSNPAHCSQDFNAETFRRPWTCSIMSRLPPTILCARFPASCSPRTSHGAPTARISA